MSTALRRFKRMEIDLQDGISILRLGEMEIWDGADLALLREGLATLIEKERLRRIAIDMTYVKYIPSGFFGMLFDWHEKRNVSFWLTTPQPNVRAMLWFQQFFPHGCEGLFALQPNGEHHPLLDLPDVMSATSSAS